MLPVRIFSEKSLKRSFQSCGGVVKSALNASNRLSHSVEVIGLRKPTSAALEIGTRDRKSTRLNSSHKLISYAVFCLTKKKKPGPRDPPTPTTNKTPPRDRPKTRP